jgi:hypothetical protein
LPEIVGLGPFVIREYVADRRLVLNAIRVLAPGRTGRAPYLDAIELQFVTGQNAEVSAQERRQSHQHPVRFEIWRV